jgi:cytochrome c oxidase assembly protein subunit 15
MKSESSRLPTLLQATLAMVFALVVWGGVVRLSGSGLAIPDWPLARGGVLPHAQRNFLIEYGHRFLAMLVGFMVLAVAILTFRGATWRRRLGPMAATALVVLALQVFMGGRVVLEELPVDRVVAHLLLAFTLFAILLKMTLIALEMQAGVAGAPPDRRARRLAHFTRVAAGAVFLQAGLGAWVASSGASLACPDFPTCQGSWLPPLEGLVGIHYAHRLGAYAVVVIVLGLLTAASTVPLPPRARWPLRISGIILAIQFLLGVANVLLRVPLPVSAAHLGTALILFGTLLVAGHELSRG